MEGKKEEKNYRIGEPGDEGTTVHSNTYLNINITVILLHDDKKFNSAPYLLTVSPRWLEGGVTPVHGCYRELGAQGTTTPIGAYTKYIHTYQLIVTHTKIRVHTVSVNYTIERPHICSIVYPAGLAT
jgi:asparagine N-glycosylation enzyme membrane subunit Stt3